MLRPLPVIREPRFALVSHTLASPASSPAPCRSFLPAIAAFLLLAGGFLHAKPQADLSLGELAPPTGDLQLSAAAASHSATLAHFSTALQLEASGKLRAATEHYVAVLKADPTNGDLAAHTAALVHRFQGYAAALRMLEEAASASPHSPRPLIQLARFCSTYQSEDGTDSHARADSALASALARFPKSAEVYEAAAIHYLARGQRERATQLMDGALRLSVSDSRFWLSLASTAGRVWPLGQIERRAEHLARVTLFFDAALKNATSQNNEEIQLEVARQYILINELSRARTLCEKLVSEKGNLSARKLLYRLYDADSDSEKALSMLEKIAEQDPEDADHRRLLAQEYEKRDLPAKAVPHLQAAIQQSGGELGDYLKLAVQLGQTAKLDDMIRVGERALRLFPEHPNVHYILAYAYYRNRLPAKAAPRFAEAERLAPDANADLLSHTFYDQYGTVLELLGRYEDAAAAWEKAIGLCPPEDKQAAANLMNSLGYMWVEQGQHLDRASELIRKANEFIPENPAYIDSLGWLHFKQGDFKKALSELSRAEVLLQPIQPEDAEILEHIGLTHQKLGDHKKALSYLEQAHGLKTPQSAIRERIARELEKLRSASDTEKK